MPDIGQNIVELVTRGMEAIGSKASTLAANTKQKVNELALRNLKDETFNQIGQKVFELWKNGVVFPEELTQDLEMILQLDQPLNHPNEETEDTPDGPISASGVEHKDAEADPSDALAANITDHAGHSSVPGMIPEDHPAEEQKMPSEEEKETAEAYSESPLSSAINDLFDNIPQVEKMAERVNSSLDEMGEQLKNFSDNLGKQISDIADELFRDNKQK